MLGSSAFSATHIGRSGEPLLWLRHPLGERMSLLQIPRPSATMRSRTPLSRSVWDVFPQRCADIVRNLSLSETRKPALECGFPVVGDTGLEGARRGEASYRRTDGGTTLGGCRGRSQHHHITRSLPHCRSTSSVQWSSSARRPLREWGGPQRRAKANQTDEPLEQRRRCICRYAVACRVSPFTLHGRTARVLRSRLAAPG